jgi:molecular chaperone DnaK (HSP70)
MASQLHYGKQLNSIPESREVIGIDLGTRNSCVSLWRDKKLEVIPDFYGKSTLPSVVSFYGSATLVGHDALQMINLRPEQTIYDVKRIIGRKFDETNAQALEQVKQLITYDIVPEDQTQNVLIKISSPDGNTDNFTKTFTPEEICAHILREAKKQASTYLKENVTKAVITIPAHFSNSQKQATLDAAKIAGLEVLRMINEPTAAAIAYGLGGKYKEKGGNILIYDLGAGTLDVSLVHIDDGDFRVLAYAGNSHLGGEDIDYVLMTKIINEYKKQHNLKNIELSKLSLHKFKLLVEEAKKRLSYTDVTTIHMDDFHNGQKLSHRLTTKFLEEACNDLFIMCMKPLQDVFISAGLTINDVDDVILVGGSTRIPKIQEHIKNFFTKSKISKLNCDLNPDEVVSMGAAIYGYILVHDEDPFSDELVLLDVTPLSLGVETLNKKMTALIPRNTVIPTSVTKTFSTDTDYQDTVAIKIFEGERKLTRDNYHLGTFILSGFEKALRGIPIINITFDIDSNGILEVSAVEKKSSSKNSIRINSAANAKGRLSQSDIKKIISEAKQHELEDSILSGKIGYAYHIETTCEAILINLKKSNTESFSAKNKKQIRTEIKKIKKWIVEQKISIADADFDELKKAHETLNRDYAPLVALTHDSANKFKGMTEVGKGTEQAEIYGDDENLEQTKYQSYVPTTSYEQEEIKTIKKVIVDLCHEIIQIVKNPCCKFTDEDIRTLVDCAEVSILWTYASVSNTLSDFVAKHTSINEVTTAIISKYDDKKIFSSDDSVTAKEELRIECYTLQNVLGNNFININRLHFTNIKKLIDDAIEWIEENPSASPEDCMTRLSNIRTACNTAQQSMITPTVDPIEDPDDSDSETEMTPAIESNRIIDDTEAIIANLPKKPTRTRNEKIIIEVPVSVSGGIRYKQ